MLTIALSGGPDAPEVAGRNVVLLPIVTTPPPDLAAEFARSLTGDPRQQRRQLTHCPKLASAALWRAHGLAHGQPFSHIDADGVGANAYALRAGCVLPADYAPTGNNIESLVAGSADPGVAFTSLASSSRHKVHLFGENDFFRAQCHYGVAMVENQQSPHGWYWAVFIGRCVGCSKSSNFADDRKQEAGGHHSAGFLLSVELKGQRYYSSA